MTQKFSACYSRVMDHPRSLKAKITAWFKVFMARSIKIYRFFTAKKSSEIYDILKARKTSQSVNTYPEIATIQNNPDSVSGSFHIRKKVLGSWEILFYEFTIKTKKATLFLQGKTVGRSDANEFLAELIENGTSRYDVIKEYELTNGQMLQIFNNVTKQYADNIIMRLKVLFSPLSGYKYKDKEVYGELSFQFIGNKCASKHNDFSNFLENSMEVELTFGLLKCAGLAKELRNTHIKLIAKSDCSFRMYVEVPHDDWITFVEKVLNVI
ncbi:MAG: hypothetical protein WAL88_10180 [Nitrosotalea sp.]